MELTDPYYTLKGIHDLIKHIPSWGQKQKIRSVFEWKANEYNVMSAGAGKGKVHLIAAEDAQRLIQDIQSGKL